MELYNHPLAYRPYLEPLTVIDHLCNVHHDLSPECGHRPMRL